MKKFFQFILVLFITILSCKEKTKKSTYVITKTLITSTGEWVISKPIDKYRDSSILYWKNGRIKEKGVMVKGYKKGWWRYYDSLGNLTVRALEDWDKNRRIARQKIFYKKNGIIDTLKSYFVELQMKDTLILNHENLVRVKLISKFFNKELRIACVKILNKNNFKYSYKDSLCSTDTIPEFSFTVTPTKITKDTLKIYLIEKFLNYTIYKKNDSVVMMFGHVNYEISKPVYIVNDTVKKHDSILTP